MLNYRQSAKYSRLIDIAPVLFNAALVSRLDALGIAGGPIDPWNNAGNNNLANALASYIKSREGLDRVEDALVAAGAPGD